MTVTDLGEKQSSAVVSKLIFFLFVVIFQSERTIFGNPVVCVFLRWSLIRRSIPDGRRNKTFIAERNVIFLLLFFLTFKKCRKGI